MWKPGNTENRKGGNPDHPEVGKCKINQRPKPIQKKKKRKKKENTEIAASVF